MRVFVETSDPETCDVQFTDTERGSIVTLKEVHLDGYCVEHERESAQCAVLALLDEVGGYSNCLWEWGEQ